MEVRRLVETRCGPGLRGHLLTGASVTTSEPSDPDISSGDTSTEEHFKPTGTLFILAMFVAALILLWTSVYIILLSRGVTV